MNLADSSSLYTESEGKAMNNKMPGIEILPMRGKSANRNGRDISITLSKQGHNRVAVNFSKESYKKITRSEYVTPRLDLAMGNRRIYFCQGLRDSGFKLSNNGKSKRCVFTLPKDIDATEVIGSYDLIFDSDYDLHYVDLGDKP